MRRAGSFANVERAQSLSQTRSSMSDPERTSAPRAARPETQPKRVILWGREDLLGRAVEFFLGLREKCEVVRLSDQQGGEGLLQQVVAFNPQVVVLYQGDTAVNTQLPLRLMQAHPGLKVVTVSLADNTLAIYSKRTVWMQTVADLFDVIES